MTRVTNEEMADMMRADIAALKAENARLREAAAAVVAFDEYDACSPDNMGQAYLTTKYRTALDALAAALAPHSTESYPPPPREDVSKPSGEAAARDDDNETDNETDPDGDTGMWTDRWGGVW